MPSKSSRSSRRSTSSQNADSTPYSYSRHISSRASRSPGGSIYIVPENISQIGRTPLSHQNVRQHTTQESGSWRSTAPSMIRSSSNYSHTLGSRSVVSYHDSDDHSNFSRISRGRTFPDAPSPSNALITRTHFDTPRSGYELYRSPSSHTKSVDGELASAMDAFSLSDSPIPSASHPAMLYPTYDAVPLCPHPQFCPYTHVSPVQSPGAVSIFIPPMCQHGYPSFQTVQLYISGYGCAHSSLATGSCSNTSPCFHT